MINTHKLELPLSRTYFHGSKVVRAIGVRQYIVSGEFGIVFAVFTYSQKSKIFLERNLIYSFIVEMPILFLP